MRKERKGSEGTAFETSADILVWIFEQAQFSTGLLGLEKWRWRRMIQLGTSVHWIDFGAGFIQHGVRNVTVRMSCNSSEEGATACQSRKTSTHGLGGGVNNASSPNELQR